DWHSMSRLGVIGYGNRMRGVLGTIGRFKSGARVVAMVDPRADELRRQYPDELADVTFYRDVDEMLDASGVGGVLIGTRCSFYAQTYYHGWMRDDQETGGLWLQKATHDFDYINFLVRQRPLRICAMESKTVFRGDMPAGMKCVECWRQEECPESPYNLFYRQGVTDEVQPNDWLCSFAVDTGNHDAASAII